MRLTLLAAAVAASFAAAAPAHAYFDVTKLPSPSVSGQEIAANVEAFADEFPMRVGGSPNDAAAAESLRAEAEKLGYKAEIISVPVANGDPGTLGRAVIATRQGVTKPDEHLLFMGHYDTVPQTINGAYDNASGTNMIKALAKSFAAVPTNRTVTFIWYSNEEQGLLASEAHAAMAKEAGMKVRAALGFDMTGIAWPVGAPDANSCLCFWHGDEDEALEPLLRHVHYDVLGFPDGDTEVSFAGVNARNSDERSWDVQGYPVLRWAGRRTAASYPAYHRPDDTIAKIEEVAGGRQFFEQGLRNTLLGAYTTALTLDNESPVAVPTASGSGPVSFDGSGSSDPDGPISGYSWDFGDGTSAVGAKVTHHYAKPGTYTATLTVRDNLWGGVTASASVPVTVTTGAEPAAKPPAKKKKLSCKAKARKIKSAKKRKKALRRCAKAKKRRARRG